MAYRKRNGSDTWHWCQNCSNWPKKDFKEQATKPSGGDQCNECKSKQKSGNCT